MNAVNLSLRDYVFAGYPAIILNTSEEERALETCLEVSKMTKSKLYVWSLTKGVYELVVKKGRDGTELIETVIVVPANDISPDEEALKKGLELNDNNGNIIYCMLDFHPFIKAPAVWRTAKDVFQEAKEKYITYIFISNSFEIPKELEHEVIAINMDLPTEEDLKELIAFLIDENPEYSNISEEDIDKASKAALGLTLNEAENAFSVSLSKKSQLDLEIINDVKRQIICKGGLLEYQHSNESLETVGGMHIFTSYATERFSAYSEEAQEYGLPYPKGVLLVGIPGCGKSLAAKALANMWHEPLIKLDLGKLFGSYVGDTEANTRKALQIAESMSPCVLWLDEIDKGLSGVGGGGKLDSGVTSRMFGTILTWLQEKKTPVYVIATANDISSLPQELLRKGRFDEIFFVDLPVLEEREEIFEIQIKKHNRDAGDFDLKQLAEKADGYNGAEIEECIVAAMFRAWNDGKRPYTTEDILKSMDSIKPASCGIMSETVKALREWSKTHNIRNANSQPEPVKESSTSQTKRVRGIRTQS